MATLPSSHSEIISQTTVGKDQVAWLVLSGYAPQVCGALPASQFLPDLVLLIQPSQVRPLPAAVHHPSLWAAPPSPPPLFTFWPPACSAVVSYLCLKGTHPICQHSTFAKDWSTSAIAVPLFFSCMEGN